MVVTITCDTCSLVTVLLQAGVLGAGLIFLEHYNFERFLAKKFRSVTPDLMQYQSKIVHSQSVLSTFTSLFFMISIIFSIIALISTEFWFAMFFSISFLLSGFILFILTYLNYLRWMKPFREEKAPPP